MNIPQNDMDGGEWQTVSFKRRKDPPPTKTSKAASTLPESGIPVKIFDATTS